MEKDEAFLTLVRFHKMTLSDTVFEMLQHLDEDVIFRSTTIKHVYIRRHGAYVFFSTKGMWRRSPWVLGRVNLSEGVGVFEFGISQLQLFFKMIGLAFIFALFIGSVPVIWSWPLILGMMLLLSMGSDYVHSSNSAKDAERLVELILEKDDSLYTEKWTAD